MRQLWIVPALLASAGVLFAVITLVALEGNEVVVVRTHDNRGELHETRTWIADHDGALIIEAANPERAFYQDLLRDPQLELRRHGRIEKYNATVLPQPEGHDLVRRLLRERYGWADAWIGLIADTSGSLAVRLVPAQDAVAR